MGSERSEKNSIKIPKATQKGKATAPVTLYFKCSGRAALNFSFFVCPLRGAGLAGPITSRGVPVDCLAPGGYLNTKSDPLLLHLKSYLPSLILLLISPHLRVEWGVVCAATTATVGVIGSLVC